MYLNKSLKELKKLLDSKKITSVDLVKEAFDRIEELDGKLHSFITLREKEDVLKEAEELDKKRTGNESLVYGIPFSIKDSFVTKNVRTTAGSKILDNFHPPYSATVIERLVNKGAILIGKNNLDAWGHGGSTENTDYETARNPWDTTRVPGGSSGGPAIAVATRMIAFAIGEDTGGSIRNPSGMCSVTGLKVTYGRVSRWGSIAYASSLDTVGPIAKSVDDAALILEVIAGKDPHDSTSSEREVEKYSTEIEKKKEGMTIGIPKEFFNENTKPETKEVIENALDVLKKEGFTIKEVSLPTLSLGVSIYYLIALSETSSNMARYDGVRYGSVRETLSPETKRRILLGTYSLSAGSIEDLYKKAQKARTLIIKEYENAFSECDVLVTPVTIGEPPVIGALSNPLDSYLEDLYTVPVNLAGIPSVSIPAGFTKNNLPIGMQIVANKFNEGMILKVGKVFQNKTNYHERTPEVK